jgi:hypothetical protein
MQPIYHSWLDLLDEILDEQSIIKNDMIDCKIFSHFIAAEILEHHDIHLHYDHIQMISRLTHQEIEQMERSINAYLTENYRGRLISQKEIQELVDRLSTNAKIPHDYANAVIGKMFRMTNSGDFVFIRSKKADIAEIVLKQFPDGVEIYKHAKELCRRGNEIIPDLFNDEREFTSIVRRLEFSDKVYLWSRGKYIHASFVSVSQQLVDELMNEIQCMLKDRPFVAVNKVFQLHKQKLSENNIPNEYALYEVLRKHSKVESVAFPKFPRITRTGVILGKNKDLIIEYILQKGGPVTLKELKEEFIRKRGWQPFTLDWSLSNEKEIIKADFGVYSLLDFYAHITPEVLEPILKKIEKSLELYPSIQVRGLFYEFESYCKGQGIGSHYLLYDLLKNRFHGRYRFPRYPHIARLDADIDNLTVTSIIEDYLLEQGCEVSREEVLAYVTEEIGGRENTLDNALLHSDKIFYYTRGQFGEYIHRDVIGWNEEKQTQLRGYIHEIIRKETAKRNKPFILIDQCLDERALPKLETDLPWTLDLLIDCVKRDSQFLLLGSMGRILLERNNSLHIQTGTDFVAYILKEEFAGAAKRKDLRTALQKVLYSIDGELLHETKVQLEKGTAPFVQLGDEFILKTLL